MSSNKSKFSFLLLSKSPVHHPSGRKCLQESVRTRTQFKNTQTASVQQDFAYEASVEYMAEQNMQQNIKDFDY